MIDCVPLTPHRSNWIPGKIAYPENRKGNDSNLTILGFCGYKGEQKIRETRYPQFPFIYSYSAELSSHQFSTIYLLPVLIAIDVQTFRNHPLATIKPESIFLLKG